MPNLKNRLCSLAYSAKNGINPGACIKCTSPCEYGRQLLKEQGVETPLRVGEPLYAATRPYRNAQRLSFLNRR